MSQNITAKIGIIGMGKMARAMIDPWLAVEIYLRSNS